MKLDKRLVLVSTGKYIPEDKVTNSDLIKGNPFYPDGDENKGEVIFDEEFILRRCGIKERRKSNLSVEEMAILAAKEALNNSNVFPSEIERIAVASISSEKITPSVACAVGAGLLINVSDPYDINAACAGFTKAINQLFMRKDEFLKGYTLVIASERIIPFVSEKNQDIMLFGDGAGAALFKLESGDKGIVAHYDSSKSVEGEDRSCLNAIRYEVKLTMPDGKRVFREAKGEMTNSVDKVRERAGWDSVDLVIPHQANLRILTAVKQSLSNRERFGNTYLQTRVYDEGVQKYGNISAATIPVALDECLRSGIIKPGERVVLTGFGAGLVCSATAIQF